MKIDEVGTRNAVARSILENGPSTAVLIGERLSLTPAGVRRHLDLLIADGILEAREPHVALTRGRGRPSKVFVMTDEGREKFEHSYDDLAVAALRFISAREGCLKHGWLRPLPWLQDLDDAFRLPREFHSHREVDCVQARVCTRPRAHASKPVAA